MKKHKILLIGDSCIDEYHYGICDRLSPEAPVPVVSIKRSETKPGMAANVYENLIALGCDVDFITSDIKSIKRRYIDERSRQHMIRIDEDKAPRYFSVPGCLNIHARG
jgi:D-beta-D-heptose 7-phosphate kinase/D-beta-D-heptose 1-phosphate adenosyltransferase